MAQVTVAMFQVHEVEARFGGQPRRVCEGADDACNIRVGNRLWRGAKFGIENRVMIGDHRFELRLFMRAGKAAGMGELEPDDEIVARAESLPVRAHHLLAQPAEAWRVRFIHQ